MKWTFATILFFWLTFTTSLRAGLADTPAIPQTVVSFGESISAGALATYQRHDWFNPALLLKLLAQVAGAGIFGRLTPLESKTYRWATGTSGKDRYLSHLGRLRKLSGDSHRVSAYEVSISGANSIHLEEEWKNLLKKMGPKRVAPDYFTIMIGMNDACGWKDERPPTPPEVYRDRVEKLVTHAQAENPDAKILIVGLPNLQRLWEIGQVSNAGIWGRCPNVWKFHDFCSNFLQEPDAQKRQATLDRVQTYNEILQEIAHDADGGRDRVRYSGGVTRYDFTADEISLDCFHPNWRGQAAIARETWRDTWWASGR